MKAFIQQIYPNQNKAVLVASIRFLDLYDKLKYSYRSNSDSKAYQRQLNMGRIKLIGEYIKEFVNDKENLQQTALFPSSIIIAIDSEHIDLKGKENGDLLDCDIPSDSLIVDGQHRFFAMKSLYDKFNGKLSLFDDKEQQVIDFLQNYHFNCCILINYDLYEQAKIFVDVNFYQKKVNKSWVYDIFGAQISDEMITPKINKNSEIVIAHSIVKYLNDEDTSVLNGYIKMLGTGKGFVSQAFLVESLLIHLSAGNIWSFVIRNLEQNRFVISNITMELTSYLAAIRFTFKDYWPDGVNDTSKISILCKTTGLGAIMRLFKDAHNSLSIRLKNKLEHESIGVIDYAELITHFNNFLKPLTKSGKRFFSINSEYANGGGAGLQAKLYTDMKNVLEYKS